MGGAIGLAIVTAVLNSDVSSGLKGVIDAEQIAAILQTGSALTGLPPDVQATVRSVFAKSYNVQFKILAGLAAVQIPSSLIMWQKKQIIV